MKLKHILEAPSFPDPSDYRAGDESNPRSPHYAGDDESYSDPSGIDEKRTPEQDHQRYETTFDENRDVKDGVTTYTAAMASQEAANERIEQIKKGASEVISVNQSTDNSDDGPIFNIEVVYSYGQPSYGDDFQEPDTDY